MRQPLPTSSSPKALDNPTLLEFDAVFPATKHSGGSGLAATAMDIEMNDFKGGAVLPPPAAVLLPTDGSPSTAAAANDNIGLSSEHDKSIPLYCVHSPANTTWRGKLRRALFPRTHSEMEVYQGRAPLNKQKTIMVDWLDYLVILLVTFTCVLLCLQDPMDRGSSLMSAIQVANNVLGFLFSLENVLRILSFGFIYFTADYWNIFDSLIVASSLVTTIIDLIGSNRQSGIEALRIFILFRVLRSVRFIDTARITMIASIRAFKSIGDVGILLVLFLVLVATGGVTQYNSKLTNRCIRQNASAFLARRDAWVRNGEIFDNGTATANSTLTPWQLRLATLNDMGNFTRFQSFDMLRLQQLRRSVEYRQCGYRYADYRSKQNITVCAYSKSCSSNVTFRALTINQTISYNYTNSSNIVVNVTNDHVSLVNFSTGSHNVTTGYVVEDFYDYENCIFIDGSVVCSTPQCNIMAQFNNRTLVLTTLFSDYHRSLNSSNVATVESWAIEYLTPYEYAQRCGVAESIPGSTELRVHICVNADSNVANLDALLAATGEATWAAQVAAGIDVSAGGGGSASPRLPAELLQAIKHNSYYCRMDVAPTNGQIWMPQSDQQLSELTFPFPMDWTLPKGFFAAEEDNVVTFPSMPQWCLNEFHNRTAKRLAVLQPYLSPNTTLMNITTDCAALNSTISSASPAANLCCGRNEVGRVVCCASTNRTDTGASNYPVDVMNGLCCSVSSAADEHTTFLAARPNGAFTSSPTPTPIVVLSLTDLANSTMFNHAVCESALPAQVLSSFLYTSNRSSSDPSVVYYSKQVQDWHLRVNLNLTNLLALASCIPDVMYNPALDYLWDPPQRLAVAASLKKRIFRVQWSEGADPTLLVPEPFREYVTPPRRFHPTTEGFNATSTTNPNFIPGLQQSTQACTIQADCYSRPLLLDDDGFDDPYDIVTYYCGSDYSAEDDPTVDDIPIDDLGLHWTDSILASLPVYDEAFRGQERQAMGQNDFEAFAWKERNCDNSAPIYLDGYKCPYQYDCTSYQNPFNGMLGFENLPSSMLTDFTCITRESWHDIMYRAMDAMDQTAAIYFLAVTIVGALFITNLMIVLLTVEFDNCVEEERKKLTERRAEEKKNRRLHRDRVKAKQEAAMLGLSISVGGEDNESNNSSGGGGDGDLGGSIAATAGGTSFASKKSSAGSGEDRNIDDDPFATDSDSDDDDEDGEGKDNVLNKLGNFLQRQLDSDRRHRSVSLGAHSGSTRRGSQETASLRGSQAASLRRSSLDRNSASGGKQQQDNNDGDGGGSDNNSNGGGDADGGMSNEDDDDPLNPSSPLPAGGSQISGFLSNAKRVPTTKKLSKLQTLRKNMRGLLYSQTGLLTINVLILGNMVVLGMVYYGMSETMRQTLDMLNFAFTVVFTAELAYRLFCIDIWNFVRSTMSMLDLVVVILSWIDIAVPSITIPIIRGVRVIRLLNVFKPFPNVYKWIKVIVRSLKSSVVLFIMCSFFTLVFAVFGMSLFGGRFCNFADGNVLRPDNTVEWCPNRPRSNYDTLVQALLTSFQIMTGDDWYLVMVNGMRARGGFFSLYFVANYVIGNMVLLNLLIGILLSVRTATDEDTRRKTALSEKRIAQARAESDFATVAMLEERAEFKRKRFALIQFKTDEEKRAEKAAANQRLYTEYSKVELRVQEFVESTPFRYTVLIMTIINTIGLAIQSPFGAPDTPSELVLWVIELATNAFFVLELLLECLAYGIFLNPKSYLKRDRWNIFDLSMVCVFLVTQITTSVTKSQGQAQLVLRGLSALRALRPIRFVAESKGMRLVIKSLMDSVGPLGNLMIVILIVMTLFGIMGVQIFQGLFYYCNGTDALISYSDLNRPDCEAVGGRWTNAPYNFDHLGEAYLTLFVLSTTEGWSTIMFNGMDATDTFNAPPVVNIQKKNAVYFIAFIVIGSIFFVNLFVSIIIDSFQQAQRQDPSGGGGSSFLTKQQNAWIRSQHTMLNHVAVLDYDGVITVEDVARSRFNAVRSVFRFICRHPLFDVFIYCCVFVNFLVMAVEEYPQSDSMEVFGKVSNIFFTTIFTLEVILRLISESPRRYMASKWNRFDLVVVFLSLLALLFELIFANATFVAFFRSMRAIRLLRLLRKSRRLQAVLRKFLMAMYSLTNIGGILFLVLFCYGLIGMKLFGRVAYDGTIDHNANFQNIFSAFLLMLRVATGGNWGDVLRSCTQSEFQGYCLDRLGDCGINVVGQIFFLTFVVVATFVLLNVFVAVILDVFTSMTGEVDILSAWDASQFMKLWFHFDPERTYRMESRFLLTFLRHIPSTCVLGMGNIPVRRRLQHELVFVESLMLEEHDGKVELQDVIHALCDRAFRKVKAVDDSIEDPGKQNPLPIERARLLKQKMDRHFRRKKRDRYKPVNCESYPVVHRIAAQIMTAYWERYRDVVLPHRAQVRKAAISRMSLTNQVVDMGRSVSTFPSSKSAYLQQPSNNSMVTLGGAVSNTSIAGANMSSSSTAYGGGGVSASSFAGRKAAFDRSSDAASASGSERMRSPHKRSSGGSAAHGDGALLPQLPPSAQLRPQSPTTLPLRATTSGAASASVFDSLAEYRNASQATHQQRLSQSSGYRSVAAPATGVLTSFRVLESSGSHHRRHQHERSVVDALLEDDDDRDTLLVAGGIARSNHNNSFHKNIGDRLKTLSQRPDVRVWNDDETMAIAQSVAAHRDGLQRLLESVQLGEIPEERDARRRITAEEAEMRSLLAWRRIHDMQNVAASRW